MEANFFKDFGEVNINSGNFIIKNRDDGPDKKIIHHDALHDATTINDRGQRTTSYGGYANYGQHTEFRASVYGGSQSDRQLDCISPVEDDHGRYYSASRLGTTDIRFPRAKTEQLNRRTKGFDDTSTQFRSEYESMSPQMKRYLQDLGFDPDSLSELRMASVILGDPGPQRPHSPGSYGIPDVPRKGKNVARRPAPYDSDEDDELDEASSDSDHMNEEQQCSTSHTHSGNQVITENVDSYSPHTDVNNFDHAQPPASRSGLGLHPHPQSPPRRDMNTSPPVHPSEPLTKIGWSDIDSARLDNQNVKTTVLGQDCKVENELLEAAFVICWPGGQCMPVRAVDEFLGQTWNGGCVISVWDSDIADAWVDKNYDHEILVQIRERKIGGPIPLVLSVDSAALAIFGAMSVSLTRLAEELANFSGFPVIVRPLDEDPSTLFRQTSGNAMSGTTKHVTSSTQSGSQGRRTHNPTDGPGKRQEDEDEEDSDDDKGNPPPPPPPPPLPIQKATSKEVVHKTDVSLKLSNNTQDKGHFLRLITKVKLYPPNVKADTDNHIAKMVSDPLIEGHVDLETRSGDSIKIDNALGSIGFLANSMDYLQTEHLIPLGYGVPQHKVKRIMGEQRSITFGGTLGVAGGKPTASVNSTTGKSTSSTTEVADDEVTKQWLVSLQRMECYWRSETSVYRGINTMIQRYHIPTCTDASDVQVKYGIAVEVANPVNEVTTQVSFLYRHQIHCWVAIKSKARVRGLIVLAAHFIPDIRTERPLWIEGRPTLDLLNMNIRESSENKGAASKQEIVVRRSGADETGDIGHTSKGTTDDHFVFAAATPPEPSKRRWTERFFNGSREQEMTLPISALVARGWNRTPLGWDHTNMKWYYPIWPELDSNFGCSSNGSRVRLRLDWGDGDGHDSESQTETVASDTSVFKTEVGDTAGTEVSIPG